MTAARRRSGRRQLTPLPWRGGDEIVAASIRQAAEAKAAASDRIV